MAVRDLEFNVIYSCILTAMLLIVWHFVSDPMQYIFGIRIMFIIIQYEIVQMLQTENFENNWQRDIIVLIL